MTVFPLPHTRGVCGVPSCELGAIMSQSNGGAAASSGGVGLCGLVFVVFLVLKLAEIGQVAHWSWWWVTAPLWMPLAFVLALVVVFGCIALLVAALRGGR